MLMLMSQGRTAKLHYMANGFRVLAQGEHVVCAKSGAPIALDGTLDTAKGKKAIRVEIVTEPCTDEADVAHPQRVTVTVQGEAAMRGCGDLAVY